MPLTLRFTLNKTAGRKGGDEADPTTDHRVTSKPWQKRDHSIAEKRFWGCRGPISVGQDRLACREGGTKIGIVSFSPHSGSGHSRLDVGDASFHVCANLTISDESTDSAVVPGCDSWVGVNQLRNIILAEF